jgi:PAS domain S-box-containing protein
LGILHFDKNGVVTDCNDEFASIIGTNKSNLIGFNMLTTLKDLELKEVVQKSLTIGTGVYKNSYTSVISGKTTPVVGRFNAVYSDEKQIIGGVGLIEDITDRNNHEKLQKALFEISATSSKTISIKELYGELHEIIKRLMPAENVFIAIHNKQTNLITFPYHVDKYDATPKPKMFGNGLAEYILKTKTSRIITAEMDIELQKIGKVELSGESAEIWVGVYLDFEGDYQGVLALQDYENPNAYSEEDLKVLQFVSEQIVKVLDKKYADRRLLESVEQLSLAKKELEVINKNKDMFFSIIAHDLRAPFNTLLGVTELISGNMDEMSMKEVKEISRVIHSSTNNLFKLIENLLSWSRLQMGVFQINPVKLSISEVINDVLEVVSYSALDKKIMIENRINNFDAIVDEECLKTVVRNLLNNAIKFTNRFGNIILSSVELESHIQITIKDNGVGIKEGIIPKLFSISSKTSTIGTESEKGTGLGLILCKDLIEKNNGTIWVESQIGKGSEFSFTIPKG